MTQDETRQIASDIVAEVERSGELVGVLDQNLIPYVILGRAFDKNIRGLATMVDLWVRGNKPNREEQQQLELKLAILYETH